MVVQYKGGTRYLCNYLRQQYRVPVCEYIPADPVDAYVVQAFFAALSPVELDAYSRTMKAEQQSAEAIDQAQRQQLERLRYQAALAERYFNQADPDNRLVTAELERRWEAALRELKEAEQNYHKAHQAPSPPAQLSPELKAAFCVIGQKLPELWSTQLLSQTQKKALLRCLIDKVVIHRIKRDQVHTRIIWKGGNNSSVDLPIAVGSLAELTHSAELEERILSLHRQGMDDLSIARQLSSQGYRSPLRTNVLLPSTVRGIRLKHRLFIKRSQSHPRHIPGSLTLPELAQALDIPRHWLYDRIHNGTIVIDRDGQTGLYLFPDHPHTLEQFKQLRAGQLKQLRFDRADSGRTARRP